MNSMTLKKIGAVVVVVASIAYFAFRVSTLIQEYSTLNLLAATCEITLLALVCVESTLMATQISRQKRKQDENVLLESAKSVLFSSTAEVSQAQGGAPSKLKTTNVTATGSFNAAPVDVVVFAEEATQEQLRRCFLSLNLIEDVDHVYLIDSSLSPEREELAKEFSYFVADSFHNIAATTQQVLICRGSDILYPDACKVARTYETDETMFLELRSVYSDERALGVNGVVEVSDKRQMIREALSTRSLSTWSTGPAMVNSKALEYSAHATTAAQFFRACEKHSIHGQITEEIVSEEISHEQTISEVEWRALDFKYSSGAWKNSYDKKGSKLIGLGVKTWSAMINASLIRRVGAIALILAFVIRPAEFSFVTPTYLAAAGIVAVFVFIGEFLIGDRRGIFARIREYYFDVEAVTYNMYKSLIKPERRASDKSIVKKLPSVSALLVATDAVLVYRVALQYNKAPEIQASQLLKYFSLFSGYALIVSLLVGLGMVIVRQSRSAQRREISRGANLDSQPVSMIDLSPGGAGVISVSPFEPDTEIQFESSLPSKDENTKFRCTATVRSCVAWNDSYRVGLEFAELDQEHKDILETYCSIVYPHAQARQVVESDGTTAIRIGKLNGKAEKRFLSYAASFIALGAIIFSNLSGW